MTEEEIINSLGFDCDNPFDVIGKNSISHLFTENDNRCGIYLLKYPDNTYYIGKSKDVVKRFRQHCMSYENIVHVWFQSVEEENLDGVERQLIHNAESDGLLLINSVHVSSLYGESRLDNVISRNEQQEWLENGKPLSNGGVDLYPTVQEKYKIRYRKRFDKLKKKKDYTIIKLILNTYIHKCLPAFKKTEKDFWSLSCLPTTGGHTFQ